MPEPVISPTPLPPPEALAAPTPAPASDRRQRLALGALAAVGLLALAVTFVLPRLRAPAQVGTVDGTSRGAAEEPPDPILTEEEKAAARLDAQDALAEVLTALEAIAARDVAHWNPEGWRGAQALVAAGEKAYRQQRYPAAIRTYREAGRAIEALNAQLPQVVAEARAEAEAAFARRDGTVAGNALERVLQLAPGDPAASRALERARNLARVDALLGQATGYERLGDTAQARAAFEAALSLDPQEPTARRGLARLAGNAAEEAFESAMSGGHQAMADGTFETAVAAFEQARKLQPDNPAATRALAQARERQAAARLAQALANAARLETAERWDEASAALANALAMDRELDALKPRLERARERAALAATLEQATADRGALAEDAFRIRAEAALRQAQSVAAPGPRLSRQIKALQTALTDARETPPAH